MRVVLICFASSYPTKPLKCINHSGVQFACLLLRQVWHRKANHWRIINLLRLDVLSFIHQKIPHAWNIRGDVYQHSVYVHEVLLNFRPFPGGFRACVLHFVEKRSGKISGYKLVL